MVVMVHAPLPALHLADRLSSANLVGRPRGGASSEARRQLIICAHRRRHVRALQTLERDTLGREAAGCGG